MHDRSPYGLALAEAFADYLILHGTLHAAHRDYCGVGFAYENGRFVYDFVYDGYLGGWSVEGMPSPLASFEERTAFVGWLAIQSDESLCGREIADPWYVDNQRITRAYLEEALQNSDRRRKARLDWERGSG